MGEGDSPAPPRGHRDNAAPHWDWDNAANPRSEPRSEQNEPSLLLPEALQHVELKAGHRHCRITPLCL